MLQEKSVVHFKCLELSIFTIKCLCLIQHQENERICQYHKNNFTYKQSKINIYFQVFHLICNYIILHESDHF